MKHRSSHAIGQSGFSLIELMIASTIGLIVIAAVGSVFVASRQTQRTADGMARIQETSRTASLVLDATIRHAGYLPDPRNQIDPTSIFVSPRLAISGGSATAPRYIGIANALTTSDYVALTFVGNDDMSLRTCLGDIVDSSQRAFVVFYLSKQGNDDTPSLSCATEITSLAVTGAITVTRNEPIKQGISAMQIRYGIDTTGDLQTDRYVEAAAVAKLSIGESAMLDNWNHVTSVEVTLMTQSEAVERGKADSAFVADGRLDRPIRQTIAMRNRLVP